MDGKVIKLPEYTELINKAMDWDYGTLHTHEEIAEIMGLIKNTQRYHSMVSRANKILIEKSKMLQNIKGQGYKVILPSEYIEASQKEVKKARDKFKKAASIVDGTPEERLTLDELSKYRNFRDRIGVAKAIAEGIYKEVATLVRTPLKLNSGRG